MRCLKRSACVPGTWTWATDTTQNGRVDRPDIRLLNCPEKWFSDIGAGMIVQIPIILL